MVIEEIAGTILARSARSVEIAAQNLANMTTAGYKAKRQAFPAVEVTEIAGVGSPAGGRTSELSVDFSAGKLQKTGNPLDLAISSNGFFSVRSGGTILYTRSGQFKRDGDGHLVMPGGAILQSFGGDLAIDDRDFTVLADGTIQQGGQPVAQIAVVDFDNKSILRSAGEGFFTASTGSAAREVPAPQMQQGVLETSNVSTADEMTALMMGVRSAETGQRVVQTYDDLMGQALITFGQR